MNDKNERPNFDSMTEAQFARHLAALPAIVRWLHHLDTLHDQATELQMLAESVGRMAAAQYAARIAQACMDATYATSCPSLATPQLAFAIGKAEERFLNDAEASLHLIEQTILGLPQLKDPDEVDDDADADADADA